MAKKKSCGITKEINGVKYKDNKPYFWYAGLGQEQIALVQEEMEGFHWTCGRWYKPYPAFTEEEFNQRYELLYPNANIYTSKRLKGDYFYQVASDGYMRRIVQVDKFGAKHKLEEPAINYDFRLHLEK